MTTDVTRHTGAPAEDSGISRRTVVRGVAATAWAVPAVTLVTAAPAFAVSATLNLSLVTANYLNATNAATVDPSQLQVGATVTNTGAQATLGAVVTIVVPGNRYDLAPTATAPGFGSATVSGSFGDGWTLAFTAESQIAPGAENAQPFSATISFNDTGGAPYRKWAGTTFPVTLTANASNATPGGGSATVAQTPNGTFAKSGTATIANNSSTGDRAKCTLQNFWNAGRSSIGQITVVVTIPKGSSSSVWGNVPESQPQNTDSKWTFSSFSSANNLWAWTFTSNITAYGPVTLAGSNGPAANNSFYTEVIRKYVFGDINNNLPSGLTFKVSAPRADTVTWTV